MDELPLLHDKHEIVIPQKSRLQDESIRIREILKSYQLESVLDVHCRGGELAVELGTLGFKVTGTDANPKSIELAEALAKKKSQECTFVQAQPGTLAKQLSNKFDAVLCLGNYLSTIIDPTHLYITLRDMVSLLSPHGILIIQLQNYERLLLEKQRFQPVVTRKIDGNEYYFLRMYDFLQDAIQLNVISISRDGDQWDMQVNSKKQNPLTKSQLQALFEKTDIAKVDSFGSLHLEDHHDMARELVMIAEKPDTKRAIQSANVLKGA